MRSYEDISNRIMERGDKLIESRRIRAAKIRHTTYAVSGMCAAAIAGIGVWRLTSDIKKPDGGFSGSVIVSETVTDPEAVITAVKTTNAVVTTSEKTTAVKTTAVAADKKTTETTAAKAVSTGAASTAAPAVTTAVTTEKIPVVETTTTEVNVSPNATVTNAEILESGVVTSSSNTSTEAEPVTIKAPTGEETATRTTTVSIEDGAVTTKPNHAESIGGDGNTGNGGSVTTVVTTTTSIQDAFRTYPTYITLHDVRYDKEGIVAAENIGSRISRVDVTIQYHRQFIRDVMSAYRIDGIDEKEAVAVRLTDTDEYYLFRNASYKKED